MSAFQEIMDEVDRGRQGLNAGASMGLPRLESIIDGVNQGTYTLIISSSGSGKTSFSLYSYVYRPLMEHLNDDNFKAIYFSLEMNRNAMFIKLLSIYIFETFGRVLTYKEILSRKRNYILDNEGYELVKKCENWINAVEKKIEFYDKSITANSLYAVICDRMERCGHFEETETRKLYIPNNPNLIYLVIIDHIALVRRQPGNTLKQEIDTVSSYLVTLREMCNISPVVIQQANREHGSTDRLKMNRAAFNLNDSKDSGNTVNDCNIMLAVFDPFKDGIAKHQGYDIKELKGTFRSCQVLKNRFGECDVEVGMQFFGGINYFIELPYPNQITDYNAFNSPQYILNQLNQQT